MWDLLGVTAWLLCLVAAVSAAWDLIRPTPPTPKTKRKPKQVTEDDIDWRRRP